ncbi:hypothetical protein F5880DRAFT_1616250 [Lentinula raphanica]|nr:hypothetical protein F5880DRAFT_1616250 [Lentinula raphanica]
MVVYPTALSKRLELVTQDAKTRSERDVATTFVRRDRHITAYNHARCALINLGAFNPTAEDAPYPLLKPEDTHRHNVNIKRRLGDSKRREGLLWTVGAASDLLAKTEPSEELRFGLTYDLVPIPLVTPTQMTQRASAPTGPRKKEAESSSPTDKPMPAEDELEGSDLDDSDDGSIRVENAKEKAKEKKETKFRKESWLWSKGTRNMTANEIRQWELEGDRIQWFRAEAEMYRWMEQFESKHAEFERIIEYFRTMASAWTALGNKQTTPGYRAYANYHANMFTDLANDADMRYKRVGHPVFMNFGEGEILADRVLDWRKDWLKWMDDLDIHRAYMDS